jgi:hypothetical protein
VFRTLRSVLRNLLSSYPVLASPLTKEEVYLAQSMFDLKLHRGTLEELEGVWSKAFEV